MQINGKTIVVMNDGTCLSRENVSNEELEQVLNNPSDQEVYRIMVSKYDAACKEAENVEALLHRVQDSYLLTLRRNSVYWDAISPLSLPKELVKAILDAEDEDDDARLQAYKNFWVLMSLNPDESCRKNLFWFLQKYGMTLARSGFFVGYRNVEPTSEPNIFTDHHSHSTRIEIGKIVSMDRDDCDADQDTTCSAGLHIASKGWLKENYYGSVGMACLVNPADVVAVPPEDSYGKLRTCAYLPIKLIEYDKNQDVIPLDVEDGFDYKYAGKVLYEGVMNDEVSKYQITIPEIPGLNKESITEELLNIAHECILKRM